MKILASEKLSSHKYKTPEGYLICTDAILARTGKQEYLRGELFTDCSDGESEERIDIDRPYDEVFNEKTISSFENKPVTFDHPDEDVNTGNYKEYAVGYVRDVHQGKTENGEDVIMGNLVITDKDAIKAIENGDHTDLSCGYDCEIKDENGSYYQSNIRGNHVALCEEGRAGIARIVDSKMKDFDNGKLKDFRIEELINLVKKRRESVNSIRTDSQGNEYTIFIDGSFDSNLETGEGMTLDVILEDINKKQKRVLSVYKASSWSEIIKKFNSWKSGIKDSKVQDTFSGTMNGYIYIYDNGYFYITHKNGKVEKVDADKFPKMTDLYKYIETLKDSSVCDAPNKQVKEITKILKDRVGLDCKYKCNSDKSIIYTCKIDFDILNKNNVFRCDDLFNDADKNKGFLNFQIRDTVLKYFAIEIENQLKDWLDNVDDAFFENLKTDSSYKLKNGTFEGKLVVWLKEPLKDSIKDYKKKIDTYHGKPIFETSPDSWEFLGATIEYDKKRDKYYVDLFDDYYLYRKDAFADIYESHKDAIGDSKWLDTPTYQSVETENRKINKYGDLHKSVLNKFHAYISQYIKEKDNTKKKNLEKQILNEYKELANDYNVDSNDANNGNIDATIQEVKSHYDKEVNNWIKKVPAIKMKSLDSKKESKLMSIDKSIKLIKLISTRDDSKSTANEIAKWIKNLTGLDCKLKENGGTEFYYTCKITSFVLVKNDVPGGGMLFDKAYFNKGEMKNSDSQFVLSKFSDIIERKVKRMINNIGGIYFDEWSLQIKNHSFDAILYVWMDKNYVSDSRKKTLKDDIYNTELTPAFKKVVGIWKNVKSNSSAYSTWEGILTFDDLCELYISNEDLEGLFSKDNYKMMKGARIIEKELNTSIQECIRDFTSLKNLKIKSTITQIDKRNRNIKIKVVI